MRTCQLILIVTLISVSGAACAKARANIEPVMPVLAPPPPPPRVVESYPEEPVPTITPGPLDAALATPPVKEPSRAPVRPEPPKPEPEVTEPEPPTPSAASLTLKPAPGVAGQTEASIRALLERASRDLQRVNYAALNADGRTQFDTARRFMQQSEDWLKAGNLALAGKLADKAATMAAVLVR